MSKPTIDNKAESGAKAEQVRAAARKLFMANGYRCTTMDQIAQLAEVSKTTLYAYYPNKEALFLAMVDAEKRRVLCLQVPEDLDDGPVDVRAILTNIAKGMAKLLTDQSMMAVFRTVLAESGQSPELGRALWEAGPKAFRDRIAKLFERLAEAGHLKIDDATLAATRFVTLARGELHIHSLMDSQFIPDQASLDRHVDQAVDFFLGNYLPPTAR